MAFKVLFVDRSGSDAKEHEHLAGVLDRQSVNDLTSPFFHDHVQECLLQMAVDASVSNDFVSEEDQAQVVDVFAVVLLHVHSVHVHLAKTELYIIKDCID